MSIRKNRRAVLAELLLLADPKSFDTHHDGKALAIGFDTVAQLRSWLHLAGLNDPNLLTGEHEGTTDDGRPYRRMTAYPIWHGWEIYASAFEYTDAAAPLDPGTADQLTTVAVAA